MVVLVCKVEPLMTHLEDYEGHDVLLQVLIKMPSC